MAFPTTRWSVVLAAKEAGAEPRKAMHELCADYWQPLFAFLRRSGMSVVDAEDTVQGFVSSLLKGPAIEGVDPQRGRFRSYVLGALRNYVAGQRSQARALKRGGGETPLTLDGVDSLEIPDDRTPEAAYAYAWAMAILERTEARLAEHFAAKGKEALFDALRPTLLSGEAPRYEDLAVRLKMSEGATRVAAHRIRARFGTLLREEVRQTVSSPSDVDDELRAVIAAVSEPGR